MTSVVPSSSVTTVTMTDSVNTVGSIYEQSSQGQSPVISRPTSISSHDSVQAKVSSHSAHSYEASIRTTAVVTPTPASHLTSSSSAVPIKCSTVAPVSTPTIKSELPPVYTAANIPPTPISEHISSAPSCKPLPLGSVPVEHSSILVKPEVHTTSPSVNNVTVPTTWPSSKVSNRIADAHAHVSTIQSTASSNSAYPSKLEVRPSKVPHPNRSNSAFTQQASFQISNYDDPLSGAHSLSSSGGVIADLLQNQFLPHKEYFVPGGQHHEANIVQMVRSNTPGTSNIPPELARLGESPHTPTPPITSSHPLPSTDSHSHVNSALHIRQPPIMVPHSSRTLHHSEIALMHQQMMFAAHNSYPHHSDIRVQQDVRAMGINSHFGYHAMSASSDVSNNFKQPPQHRHQSSIMDAKAEQKVVDDLSKVLHEARASEEKSQRSKSMRGKNVSVQKEKELKMIFSENREDVESSRLVPSTSAIAPHNSRQPQHAHFASQILQMSSHIPSPHDRTTDSPVTANLYNAQGRLTQIPLAGQVDERKFESSLGAHSSHLYKNDASEGIKPPIAHQTQPSTSPYHSRQQLLGVPQIGSTAPAHIDGRSSNPAHSPNSHSYKKDSHSQQITSLHNPAIDKIVSSEHSAKGYNARAISRQSGSSISPGPWSSGLQSQSPRPPMILNDQSAHVPPPAHAMSQAANVAISHQPTPSHASQHADQFLLQRYPVIWQGLLALKNDQAAVQMHFVSGNLDIARASLPPVEFETSPLRIAQRMRLEPQQLEGVKKKIQMMDEHCVLMALPCGKDHVDVFQQSNSLKTGFINYLQRKSAAGIVNAPHPGSQQPAYVIHIFPSCDFTNLNLIKIAPDLLKLICEITHLVIIIATV